MTSWSEIPTEIKLVIVHSYIELILSEIDDLPRAGEWSDRKRTLTTTVYDQLLDLAVALPFLRKEIVSCCADMGAQRLKDFLKTSKLYEQWHRQPIKCDLFVLEEVKYCWARQPWQDFCWAMRTVARRLMSDEAGILGERPQ